MVENLSATYAYINQVNTIKFEDQEAENHLLNIGYQTPFGKVVSYAYLLNNKSGATDVTHDTFGLSFKGKAAATDNVNVLYAAEYASQTQNSGVTGAKDNDAEYTLIEAGASVYGVTLLAGMEVLGGDGTYGFATPLATKHAHNGWADQFLGTSAKGLNDTYAKVAGKVAGIKLAAIYHDFSSDEDSDDLGSEINLLAAKKFDDNFSAGIKFAQYSEGDTGTDTDKLWVWAEAKF